MLEALAVLLLLFWVGGLVFHIAGGLIHLLLVAAIALFLFRLVRRNAY